MRRARTWWTALCLGLLLSVAGHTKSKMAIDGTPPTKLPATAQPILLNDFDLFTAAQFPGSGTGPYTVPTGRRLVITGAAISYVELTASPPAGGRDFLIQPDALESDGHPVPGQVHTILGIIAPPV